MPQNPEPRPKKVTLQDVADEAAVSKATASLVLRNNPRISEPTRQRVLAAVESLGYVYNQRAASLRTQRSYTVGLIVTDLSNPFYAELTAGIESQLAANDFSLLLGTTSDDLNHQSRVVTAMLQSDVDGLMLVPAVGVEPEFVQKLVRHSPLVLVTRYLPYLAVDYVGMDNEMGVRRAVEFLVHQGHRRIAFIGGQDASSARRDRLNGYRSMLEKYELPFDPSLCITSTVSRRGGYEAIHRILAGRHQPTAAICYNDVVAFGVMLGLRAAGIEPGKQFAVIGFDDVAEASLWQPSLTTISTNPTAIGREAARLLLKRIAHPDMPIEQIIMPSTLIQRDSSAIPLGCFDV